MKNMDLGGDRIQHKMESKLRGNKIKMYTAD